MFGDEEATVGLRGAGGPRRVGLRRTRVRSGRRCRAPSSRCSWRRGRRSPQTRPYVLEAMKMESEVRSQKTGTVSEVRVVAGQTVRSGDTLISVE